MTYSVNNNQQQNSGSKLHSKNSMLTAPMALAALEELNAHSTNGTWKLIPRPTGKKVIGSKWVFKVKRNTDGSIECYKGRLVLKQPRENNGQTGVWTQDLLELHQVL